VNINLEEHEVKPLILPLNLRSLVMIRVVQHAHLLLHTLRHQHPRIASTNRSDDAASPRTNLTRLSEQWVLS
jgi:hypothetical protein